ncbi:MAG: metallophosphoesterase family protein [Lachnospiraceae bacterium]
MKILIVSDSHGRTDDIEVLLKQTGPIDAMFHCGDVERGEDYIRCITEAPVHMVAGNNDFYSQLPRDAVIPIGEHKILLTHGHYDYVNGGLKFLEEHARKVGADIVFFGHTHVPCIKKKRGIIFANPGSISYPRQEGREKTYLILELDEMGGVQLELYTL